MSPSKATNQATRKEWRELGFFYDRENTQWRLVGSKTGLLKFRDLLLKYVKNPRHAKISEHDHYGPYMYLEIATFEKPGIDEHSIHGTISDLERLGHLVATKLAGAIPGTSIQIEKDYTMDNGGCLLLEVKEDGFDPVTADPAL